MSIYANIKPSTPSPASEPAPARPALPSHRPPHRQPKAVEYDPSEHTIAEVLAFIEANPSLEDAVLASEAEGKARRGILDRL